MASWRSMTKIARSGSISQRHESADPDTHKKCHGSATMIEPFVLFLTVGDLCHGFGGQKLLQPEQVINISAFLMDLLSQTKHRGAFEQAYVAFTKVRMAIQYPTVWVSSVLWIYVQNLHEHKVHLHFVLLQVFVRRSVSFGFVTLWPLWCRFLGQLWRFRIRPSLGDLLL